jgi:hypothetical protein
MGGLRPGVRTNRIIFGEFDASLGLASLLRLAIHKNNYSHDSEVLVVLTT